MVRLRNEAPRKQQEGFALAIVLLILLVLLVLTASVLFSTATNATITGNYRISNETFSVANAGLERVINWFTNEYSPQKPPPNSPYDVSPLGIKFNNKPVEFRGTPDANGIVPASNFPDAAIINSFKRDFSEHEVVIDDKNYGKYSIDARLLSITLAKLPFGGVESIERWEVNIKASEPNMKPSAQITALIEIGTPSFFGYAIKADKSIDIQQDCIVDAYNSNDGPYGVNDNQSAPIGKITDPASIGSNGDVDLKQNVTIYGEVDYLGKVNFPFPPGVDVRGGIPNKLVTRILFDDVTFTLPATSLGNINLTGLASQTLTPGRYGKVELTSGASLTLLPGTYFFDELKMAGSTKVFVNATGSNITRLYVRDKVDMQQQSEIVSTGSGTLAPTNFILYTEKLFMQQQTKLTAAVNAYTNALDDGDSDDDDDGTSDDSDNDDDGDGLTDLLQNGEVSLQQDAQIFGAVATRVFKMQQNCKVHYDTALRDEFKKTFKFRLVYWTYKNFY